MVVTYLVAVDGSEEARRAFRSTLALVQPHDKLFVLQVVDSAVPSAHEDAAREAHQNVSECEREARRNGLHCEGIVESGVPRDVILAVTAARGVHLLVVGSRVTGPRRSSVSDHCVQNASCAVMVCK